MRFHYTIANPAAIVGGVAAAGGAIALLVRDAFTSGWSVDHALMPVLVGITILSGHLLWEALRRGRLIAAFGLALLAIFGSGLTVIEAMGRRAEVRDVKVASAVDVETQRKHLRVMLTEAEEILAKHRALLATECASGKGKKCDGMTYTVLTWESAVAGYEAKLAKLGAPKPVDPKGERVAAVVAFFTSLKEGDVKKGVALLEPFAMPLFLELGSIVLFSFGFSGRKKREIAAAVPAEQVTPVAEPMSPTPKGGSMTKIEAERDLVTLLALGKAIPSQDWLTERWGVGKGTTSKWLADWEDRGLVTRTQSGHCKLIEPA